MATPYQGGELSTYQFSTHQSEKSPLPATIAAAATITPTARLTFLTGTTQVGNITPPLAGHHELVLIFTDANPGAFVTTGNIKSAYTPIQNRAILLEYDPVTAKYWVMSVT
jgi:hypothetical protein